jgi:IclR family acetate operon transcriptional repressor
VGKSILAGLTGEEVEAVWATSAIAPRTPRTITDLADMRQELEKICRLGYAVDDEENEAGVRCVAASIRNSYGSPFAAISISAAVQRMPMETIRRYGAFVTSAADDISRLYGYAGAQREEQAAQTAL